MMRASRYLYAIGASLARKFHTCTPAVKRKLVKTYCYQIYTSQLWYNYTQYSHNKVKSAYNSVLRRIFKVPRFQDGVVYSASSLFVGNHLRNYTATIRNLVYRFRTRIEKCLNPIIVSVLIYSSISKIHSHWSFLLKPP